MILIDEIDKMGADCRGDPSSAMLEVLDPEQNKTLPRPLPRPAVRPLEGAVHLHREHARHDPGAAARPDGHDRALRATPRRRSSRSRSATCCRSSSRRPGSKRSQLTISDTVLRTIIREYTREAGVRNLERRLADVCRKAATQVAKGKTQKTRVDDEAAARVARAARASPARCGGARRQPGVATGLAYTAAGGDVLFIEATAYPGKGDLTVTGQLGDVMQESAQAALSWVRSHTDAARRRRRTGSSEHDIHIHVPAGAVPKDGPSAGVTIATAIASLVRGEPVADDVGMTGEITLTGQVLPIGGIREKSLAAQRAGLKRVILPRENEPDLAELPPETRDGARVHPGRHDRGRLRRRVRRQEDGFFAARAAGRGTEAADTAAQGS